MFSLFIDRVMGRLFDELRQPMQTTLRIPRVVRRDVFHAACSTSQLVRSGATVRFLNLGVEGGIKRALKLSHIFPDVSSDMCI